MVLRFLGTAALAVLCASCATVSMQPASMTASIVRPKSDLQQTAEAFSDDAADAGWVQSRDAVSFITTSLFGNNDDESAAGDYVEVIQASSAPVADVQSRLQADTEQTLIALTEINAQANALLSSDNEIVRGDVSSFEDALITARDCRRSFNHAADALAERDATVTVETEIALSGLDEQIDRMSGLADQLVERWRNEDVATS